MQQQDPGPAPAREIQQSQQLAAADLGWSDPVLHAAPIASPARVAWGRVAARMAGPGGLYNLGNAIGLLGGVALAIAAASSESGPSLRTGLQATYEHLAGSTAALSISLAMLIFFWSGEVYHRAWANGFPPDRRLNRQGDLTSGFGALALGTGMFLYGQPLLGATAGLLHAFGKFGSAFKHPPVGGPKSRWPDPFRIAVPVSRIPALILALIALLGALSGPGTASLAAIAAPAMLIVCYLIWMRADLILLADS